MATRVDQTDYIKTALRLPPELHAQVHAAAEESGRTYNAEILSRLIATFDGLVLHLEPNVADHLEEAAQNARRTMEQEAAARIELSFLAPALEMTRRAMAQQDQPAVAALAVVERRLLEIQATLAILTGGTVSQSVKDRHAELSAEVHSRPPFEVPVTVRGEPKILRRGATGELKAEDVPPALRKKVKAAVKRAAAVPKR